MEGDRKSNGKLYAKDACRLHSFGDELMAKYLKKAFWHVTGKKYAKKREIIEVFVRAAELYVGVEHSETTASDSSSDENSYSASSSD